MLITTESFEHGCLSLLFSVTLTRLIGAHCNKYISVANSEMLNLHIMVILETFTVDYTQEKQNSVCELFYYMLLRVLIQEDHF